MTLVQTLVVDLAFLYILFFTGLSVIGAPVAAEKRRMKIGTGNMAISTIIFAGGEGLAVFALWQIHAGAMTVVAVLLWASQAYYIARSIYMIGRRINYTKLVALREVFLGITIIVLAAVLAFG